MDASASFSLHFFVMSLRVTLLAASCSLGALLPAGVAYAQALPTATRRYIEFGIGYSVANPDYGYPYVQGISGFVDAQLDKRLGAQIAVHQLTIVTPIDIGEASYMIGPRFNVLSQDRFRAYVKGLGGFGRFSFQQGSYLNPHADTYALYAIGGGFEYRASRHFNMRPLDLEVQRWPGFAADGLSPIVTTFGVSYIP
jgi:hypothetical protein